MLFGHVKGEWPHPDKLRGRGKLDAELDRAQAEYNTLDSETPQSVVQRPSATRPDNGRLSGTSACDASTAMLLTRNVHTSTRSPTRPPSPMSAATASWICHP